MDISQSITFINSKGSSMEKARLRCILDGTSPAQKIITGFQELQNEDGGFPFGLTKGNLSTINETTVALWWMEELNWLSSPAASQAFVFLLHAQGEDGSWEEDPQVAQYELPPWIQLGDHKTRLYLSAYASYWLVIGGFGQSPALRRAIHYLIRNQEASGRFSGYLHTTWIATGVFLMLVERYRKVADMGIKALSDRPLPEWEASQIAWALDCLSRGGLPRNHPFVENCLAELVSRQAPDGSWASEDGEASAVSATIQSLKVLKRYGMITGGEARKDDQ